MIISLFDIMDFLKCMELRIVFLGCAVHMTFFRDPFTILFNCALLEQYFMADNSFTGLNKILFVTQGKKKD